MYEGGQIGQGRICRMQTTQASSSSCSTIPTAQVIQTLQNDGVDFDTFYACAYESQESTGGWLPLESAPRHCNPWISGDATKDGREEIGGSTAVLTFAIPPLEDTSTSRRIDIKLFHRPKALERTDLVQSLEDVDLGEGEQQQLLQPSSATTTPTTTIEHSSDALHAISSSVPGGKIKMDGYFGIGILHPKTAQNVGTLWRSAYQLGASVLYTIGARYKSSSTDTLSVPARIPLIELDEWSSFAAWAAPKSAVWVCVEMGGTPLSEFVHPRNAIYILGSEDHGMPKSVVRGCREVVSLESEMYGSYNVAVAGSIVMYDRLMKTRKAEERQGGGKKK